MTNLDEIVTIAYFSMKKPIALMLCILKLDVYKSEQIGSLFFPTSDYHYFLWNICGKTSF